MEMCSCVSTHPFGVTEISESGASAANTVNTAEEEMNGSSKRPYLKMPSSSDKAKVQAAAAIIEDASGRRSNRDSRIQRLIKIFLSNGQRQEFTSLVHRAVSVHQVIQILEKYYNITVCTDANLNVDAKKNTIVLREPKSFRDRFRVKKLSVGISGWPPGPSAVATVCGEGNMVEKSFTTLFSLQNHIEKLDSNMSELSQGLTACIVVWALSNNQKLRAYPAENLPFLPEDWISCSNSGFRCDRSVDTLPWEIKEDKDGYSELMIGSSMKIVWSRKS